MNNSDIDNKKIRKEIDKFQKKGNIQKAIETCRSAIAMDVNNSDLRVKLGDLYMQWHLDIYKIQQYADEAITEYQMALESCVESADIYYKIGMAFYYKRELDKAVNYFKLALQSNPKMAEAYFMLADMALGKGDFVETEEYAKNAIHLAPLNSSRAYYLIYNVLTYGRKKKQTSRLLYLLLSFLTLPFDKYALKSAARKISYIKFVPNLLKISYIVMTQGFSERVIDIYKETIEKAPGFIELYLNLGRVYYELQRYDDAINEYRMALLFDSINVKAYYYLRQAYEAQHDYENATKVCRKLIEIQPYVADFHCKIAQYLYLQNEIDEAIEHYQTAITLNPKSEWTSVVAETLGFIFQEHTKELNASINAYQTASILNPEDIDINLNLGNVFFEKGSYDNALIVYKKALELSPTNPKLHCNLGYLYYGKNNIDEAIKEYEKAIKYDRTYAVAYNNLGVIYLDDLGKIKEAIELFKKAKENDPNYALANYNLARSIAITGDKVEAAKLFQVALEINSYTEEIDPIEIEEKIQDLFN